MNTFKELLQELCDNKEIQNLLKADNLVATSDPEELSFKDDNSELKIKVTDNSLSFSYSSVYKPDTTREDFTAFCDQLDDDFFQQVCESYTEEHGEESLNELNKNLTKEGIEEFQSHVKKVINENINRMNKYLKLL